MSHSSDTVLTFMSFDLVFFCISTDESSVKEVSRVSEASRMCVCVCVCVCVFILKPNKWNSCFKQFQ